MEGKLKFIKLHDYSFDQGDKDIAKREYDKTMKNLYNTLRSVGQFPHKRERMNEIRDEKMKDLIQNIDSGMSLMAYREIISDTDVEYIKNVTIIISPTSDTNMEFFKRKLGEIYEQYNTSILSPTSKKPFLVWDNELKIDDKTANSEP